MGSPHGVLKALYYYGVARFAKQPFRDLEVIVASHGGVGTTFLIEFISKYRRVNDAYDRDRIKHLPEIPAGLPKDCRIVYVFGDPVDSTLSLFRRDYAELQRRKNGVLDFSSMSASGYESVVVAKRDLLGLTRHLETWTKDKARVFPVHYDRIWDEIPDLLRYLDIPEQEAAHFPARKLRRSNSSKLSHGDVDAMRRIYADYFRLVGEIGGEKSADLANF